MAERSYGGEPASERVERRRAALIDVALTVMAENRWRSATVAGLCAHANLNKRYFYESFTDLDSLAGAVIDDVASEIGRAAVRAFEAAADAPVAVQAHSAVEAVVRSIGTDRRRAIVLLGGATQSPAIHVGRTAAMQQLTDTFVRYARIEHAQEASEYPLTDTVVAFIVGGTAQAILTSFEGDGRGDPDRLIDDVTALWLAVGARTVDASTVRTPTQH